MTTNPSSLPPPPSDTRLIPITSFRAFHNNYTGVPSTGEMKLSIIVPVDDIPAAMKVATARKEVLWIEVSKMAVGEGEMDELGKVLAAQEEERKRLAAQTKDSVPHPELGFSE